MHPGFVVIDKIDGFRIRIFIPATNLNLTSNLIQAFFCNTFVVRFQYEGNHK